MLQIDHPRGSVTAVFLFPFLFFLLAREDSAAISVRLVKRSPRCTGADERWVRRVVGGRGWMDSGILGFWAGWLAGFCVGKHPRFRGVGPCKRQAGSGRRSARSVRARGAPFRLSESRNSETSVVVVGYEVQSWWADTLAADASYGIVLLAGHLSVELARCSDAATQRTRDLRLRRCKQRMQCSGVQPVLGSCKVREWSRGDDHSR